jgi:hypothetical protein
MSVINVEQVRFDRINHAMDRVDKGRVVNGKNLSADEIYLTLTTSPGIPSLKLTWLGLRSYIRRIKDARASRS